MEALLHCVKEGTDCLQGIASHIPMLVQECLPKAAAKKTKRRIDIDSDDDVLEKMVEEKSDEQSLEDADPVRSGLDEPTQATSVDPDYAEEAEGVHERQQTAAEKKTAAEAAEKKKAAAAKSLGSKRARVAR